jgi:hypothetical protein
MIFSSLFAKNREIFFLKRLRDNERTSSAKLLVFLKERTPASYICACSHIKLMFALRFMIHNYLYSFSDQILVGENNDEA